MRSPFVIRHSSLIRHSSFNIRHFQLVFLFATALAVLSFGCRRRDTVAVSGSVTFAGQAVSNGRILFISPDHSAGPAASQIENGVYHLECKPGPKHVEIHTRVKSATCRAS